MEKNINSEEEKTINKIDYSKLDKITVTTQAELDLIPLEFEGKISIKCDSNDWIQIRNSYCYPVEILGNSFVEALDKTRIDAHDNSWIVARGNSRVEAFDNSNVTVCGNASVRAHDNSSVVAQNNSFVWAYDNSFVWAQDNSRVDAHDNSFVWAHDNSTVEVKDNPANVKIRRGK